MSEHKLKEHKKAEVLTVEETNLVHNQIANINTVKTEVLKKRDELEKQLNEMNKFITLLTKVVEQNS